MIVELFDISQKINLKLMDTVRKDFKKYSWNEIHAEVQIVNINLLNIFIG